MAVGIAFYRGRDNDDWVRRLIRLSTGGPYTHCAVCFSDGSAIESSGRDRSAPGVRWRPAPSGPDWDVIWFGSCGEDEARQRAWMLASGSEFNYKRVILGGGLMLLLGRRLARFMYRWITRHDRPLLRVDCIELVYALVGGIGLPVATDPNDLWRQLWARGVTCYARTGT